MVSWFCLAFAAVVWAHCSIQAHGSVEMDAQEYKEAYDGYYDNISGLLANGKKEILEMVAVMKLRLWKWQLEDRNSFKEYHKAIYGVAEFDEVYNHHILGVQSMLATRLNQTFYQAAALYFKANPYIFKRIVIRRGGPTIEVRDPSTISCVIEATKAYYDFTQGELDYDPVNGLSRITKYYTVKLPIPELQLHTEVVALATRDDPALATRDDPLFRKVYAETLDQTQAAVLEFRMNLIKYSFASLLVGQSEVSEVADIFPSMTNIQSTTRIYNSKMNRCIGIGRSNMVAAAYDCNDERIDFDWHLIEVSEGNFLLDGHLVEVSRGNFLFKNTRHDKCLVNNEQGYVQARDCSKWRLWNIDWSRMTIKTKCQPHKLMTLGQDRFLYANTSDSTTVADSQTWSISAPYSNGAVLTPSYYKNSNPKELIRNFPKILKAYMFKQFHNERPATHDSTNFFNGVKYLPYFADLPKPIQDICNAVSDGTVGGKAILKALEGRKWNSDGYRADYEEMRKSLVYYPKEIDDSSIDESSELDVFVRDDTVKQTSDLITKSGKLIATIGDKDSSNKLYRRFVDFDLLYKWDNSYRADDISYRPGDINYRHSVSSFDADVFESKGTHLPSDSEKLYPEYGKSDENWVFIRNKDKWSGKLAFVSFANALNDMYLRAGLNMITIINADSRYINADSRYVEGAKEYDPSKSLATHRLNTDTILKERPKSVDHAMDILVDDARSIVKGQSVFNVAALTSSTLSAFITLGDVIGLSRLQDGRVETIPMTTLNNTALVAAFDNVERFANAGETLSLPVFTVSKVTLM